MVEKYGKVGRMLAEAEEHGVRQMWEVRRIHPLPERIAKTGLGLALQSSRVRQMVRSRALKSPDFPGYTFLGAGCEQVAYSNGRDVLKILYNPTSYADKSPRDLAEKLQQDTDTCRRYIGNGWTSTDFDVEHVRSLDKDAVVSRQPLVGHDLSFNSVEHMLIDRTVPTGPKRELGENILELHHATGLHVDLFGRGNVVAVSGGLAIVDTIAVIPARQAETDLGTGLPIGEVLTGKASQLAAAA